MTTQANNTQKKEPQNTMAIIIPTQPKDFVVGIAKDRYNNRLATIKDVPGEDKNNRFQVMDMDNNFKYSKPTLAKAMDALKAEESVLIERAYQKRLNQGIEKRKKEIDVLTENLTKSLEKQPAVPTPSV